MRNRKATVGAVAVAALVLGVAGCNGGDSCSDQTPPLSDNGPAADGVPDCPPMAASQRVTVQLGVCPRCDQGPPTCTVDMSALATDDTIQLVPLSPVCDANPSCPIVDPASCPLRGVTCSFTAPAAGNYRIVVIDEQAGQHTGTFDVIATGGGNSCTL